MAQVLKPDMPKDLNMKKIAFKLVTLLSKEFDGYLSSAAVKNFVLRKYPSISMKEKSELLMSDMQDLENNMISMGWIEGTKVDNYPKKNQGNKYPSEIHGWTKSLDNGRVINHGVIEKGTGVALEFLISTESDFNGFSSKAIESLLKFVEIKRRKALKAFSQDLSPENMLLEGLKISILFSRVARKHSDLRLLNAAFKMNDWYYPIFKSATKGKSLNSYLLALTEQELSAMELLK